MKTHLFDDELVAGDGDNREPYPDAQRTWSEAPARQRAPTGTHARRAIEKRRERLALQRCLQEYGEGNPEEFELPF